MRREDDEKLWEILGRGSAPGVFPFLARNVVRQVRDRSGWPDKARSWFNLRILSPAAALAAAIIAATVIAFHSSPQQQPAAYDSDPVAKIDPQDYEVVADLDELLASHESNLWDENSSL